MLSFTHHGRCFNYFVDTHLPGNVRRAPTATALQAGCMGAGRGWGTGRGHHAVWRMTAADTGGGPPFSVDALSLCFGLDPHAARPEPWGGAGRGANRPRVEICKYLWGLAAVSTDGVSV